MENVKRGRGRPRKIVAPEEHAGFFSPVPVMQAPPPPPISAAAGEAPVDSGPTPAAPFPEKSLLVMLLEKLQKKDNYGLFSEPVDPSAVPDYHQIIKNPMDFGTVKKKLDDGDYENLEDFEGDVMLICTNAMTYNAPDTIYHRLARTIQDLAKRDFNNLRNDGRVARRGRPPTSSSNKRAREDKEGGEAQPNPVVRRGPGRPPKNVVVENPSNVDTSSPGAGGYNLRNAPPVFYNLMSNDGTRYDEDYSQWFSDFPAHILREDMKYGKRNVAEMDVGRRDTYTKFHPSSSVRRQQSGGGGYGQRLVPAEQPQAYAQSLARFAKDLGPAAWEVAGNKMKAAGLPFGPQ